MRSRPALWALAASSLVLVACGTRLPDAAFVQAQQQGGAPQVTGHSGQPVPGGSAGPGGAVVGGDGSLPGSGPPAAPGGSTGPGGGAGRGGGGARHRAADTRGLA